MLVDEQGLLDTKNLSYLSKAEVIVLNGDRSRTSDIFAQNPIEQDQLTTQK